MINTPEINLDAIVAGAKRAIVAKLGYDVQLRDPVVIKEWNRSYVIRCSTGGDSPPGLGSVVVKQIKWRGDEGYNDRAGIEFLSGLPGLAQCSPSFLGADQEAGLFVMEDIGAGITLNDLLHGDDPALAEEWLVRSAAAIGRMHAATMGLEAEHDCIRNQLEKRYERVRYRQSRQFQEMLPLVQHLFEAASARVAAGYAEEHRAVAELIAEPGPFLAYTHGDIAPTNVLLTDAGPSFVDFEYGGYRHALYDAMFWRNNCPFPDAIADSMEASYRRELAAGCPDAADDAKYHDAIARVCAHRLFWSLTWRLEQALERDDIWADDLTVRQAYLLHLGSFVRLAEGVDGLQAMRESARALESRLRALWEMPNGGGYDFPVFRGP